MRVPLQIFLPNPPLLTPPPQPSLRIQSRKAFLLAPPTGAECVPRQRDADRGIKDGVRDTVAQIVLGAREIEVGNTLRAVHVGLEVARIGAAAVGERVEEAVGAFVFRPAFVDDAVAEHVVAAFGPGRNGRDGVVWVVIYVADFEVAHWVWRGHGGGHAGDGGGERGRVGVEDDLVVWADPAVVPHDDGSRLLPGSFGLAALVCAICRDDVASVVVRAIGVFHHGAVVIPAISTATAGGGAVRGVYGWRARDRRTGVLAT